MSVAELLAELRRLDAHIELDGDRLRLNAPAGVLTDDLRGQLRERKTEIMTFLHSAQQLTQQQRAIVPLQPQGSQVPIFAVAGHNGDVFCYRSLVEHIGTDQPFFGLQPPGVDEGTEPLADIESLAGYFAGQIREFRPEGPMAIAGFCAGGTVAFELARQLSESGREVTRLILFGAPYSSAYRALPELAERCSQLAGSAATHSRALAGLPLTKWRRYVADRAQARRTAAGNARDDPVMIRRAAVENATVAAIRGYKPQAFNGHVDIMLPCESSKRSVDAPLRWRRHACTSAEFVGPDGCTGDTMLLPEHAATFASFVKVVRETRHAGARQ